MLESFTARLKQATTRTIRKDDLENWAEARLDDHIARISSDHGITVKVRTTWHLAYHYAASRRTLTLYAPTYLEALKQLGEFKRTYPMYY